VINKYYAGIIMGVLKRMNPAWFYPYRLAIPQSLAFLYLPQYQNLLM